VADDPWKKFERLMAESFSRWITGEWGKGKPAPLLSRQSLMGRMVERLYGDLSVHPDCPPEWVAAASWFMATFQADAKNRKKFRIERTITRPDDPLWGWWAKLTDETASDKLRMMVARQGTVVALIYGEREAGEFTDAWGTPPFATLRLVAEGRERLTLCDLRAFLKWSDPAGLGCPGKRGG
jgi:hypothetical protein